MVFYIIGIGEQGGSLENCSKFFGDHPWHAIIGRAIYNSENIREKTLELTSKL